MADEQVSRSGVSRRAVLGGAAGAAVGLAGLEGGLAAPSHRLNLGNTRTQVGGGGTLIVDLGSEPENLDAHQILAATTGMITEQLYEGLTRAVPGTTDYEGCLAESWSTSEDGLTWTFKLREGITFHDGTPFDAAAVKFNYDRQYDETNEYYALGQWSSTYLFDFLTGVEVVDPMTVSFILSAPFSKFLVRVASFAIVSPTGVQTYREDFVDNPVGTGPYKFDRWDKGQQVVLVPWENYWSYAPSLDQVVFKAITEAGARAAQLLTGETNLAVEITPEIAEQVTADDGLQVITGPTGALWFLAMNVEFPQFVDVKVRQAVNYAIDKETICSIILNGTAEIAQGPLSPAFADYTETVEGLFTYDPDRARALLEEAGYDGTEIVFRTSIGGSGMLSPEEMATFIQDNLRDIGMNTRIETIEFVAWMDAIRDPQNELTVMSWNLPPIEPDVLFNGILSEASLPPGFNTSYWVNEEFEQLLVVGRSSLDPAESTAAYKRMQDIVMAEVPIVPVCHRLQVYGASKRVTNFVPQPSMSFLLQGVTVAS